MMTAFPVETDKNSETADFSAPRTAWVAPRLRKIPMTDSANSTHPLGGPDFGTYTS